METATFNEIVIGNKFYHNGDLFIKWNKNQAFGCGEKKTFPLSQYVDKPIERNKICE